MLTGFPASLAAVMLLCGCDRPSPEAEENGRFAPAARPATIFGESVIRGRVTYAGPVPEMRVFDTSICGKHAKPIREETVLVGDGGGLRNVIVHLQGVAASDGSVREPAVLDQINCQYVPHVLALQVGQKLRVKNSDPTLHNVHVPMDANPSVNFGMTRLGEERELMFYAPEIARARCDVHPWMSAYIGVFDHPFFAVTDEDGAFEIERLPPGGYTVIAWHERFGTIERKVTVGEDRPVEIDFTFGPGN